MKPIYQPDVQALVDSINNQILSVQKELKEEFDRKMIQRTGHLKEALTELYRKNTPIKYELTELGELSKLDQELGRYSSEEEMNNEIC